MYTPILSLLWFPPSTPSSLSSPSRKRRLISSSGHRAFPVARSAAQTHSHGCVQKQRLPDLATQRSWGRGRRYLLHHWGLQVSHTPLATQKAGAKNMSGHTSPLSLPDVFTVNRDTLDFLVRDLSQINKYAFTANHFATNCLACLKAVSFSIEYLNIWKFERKSIGFCQDRNCFTCE